jgi:hypothetical protein
MNAVVSFIYRHKAICIVFYLCFAYWAHLFFTAEMVIQFDALSYEESGQVIYKEGWKRFLETGPHREPFYSMTVAFSMRIADVLAVSYQSVQTILQIIFLFMTQLIVLALLGKLKIHKNVQMATILYLGFSPAIVNSVFSLYSEIATYPFVLAIVFFGSYSWRAIHLSQLKSVILLGGLTAIAFIGVCFTKAIFQYIYLVFIIPFIMVAFYSLWKKNKQALVNTVIYLCVTTFIFGGAVISYRFLNKKFNGDFEFTNRYDRDLYGQAVKRVERMDAQLIAANIASIPGGGVCRKFFSNEICQKCEFFHVQSYASEISTFLGDIPAKKAHTKIIYMTIDKILENPFQYIMLTIVESSKMAFWESTQLGFVSYPLNLQKFFGFAPFKDGIRLFTSSLTYFSLFYLFYQVYINRKKLCNFESDDSGQIQLIFFMLLIIVPFTGLYALYSNLTRFALPIAVLYLLCIAFTAQDMLSRKAL